MTIRLLKSLFIVLFGSVMLGVNAKELQIESFTERVEDLTANTQAVLDLNNNKCALIKISIPEKAGFEGNIVKSEYKTNEYYVYVSPGTKRIALKYPGVETLVIPIADYLDGSGAVSGRTYRLKVGGIPEEIPQLTILMPDINTIIDSLYRAGGLPFLEGLPGYQPYVWKPTNFIIKFQADIGFGNAINMQSALALNSKKASAYNFGVDLGYNVWQNEKNSLSVNVGVGYSPLSLKLAATPMSFNYFAPPAADMDGNTYYRHYDLDNMSQEIKGGFVTLPIYLGYTYNIKHWLGVYVNAGATLGFKANSNFESVSGQAYAYGIYPEYGDLKIEESYLNGFGNVTLNNANRLPVEMNGFSASVLLGLGLEARISGPLWVNVGVKYNAGMTDIYKSIYTADKDFTDQTSPVSYTVAQGESVTPLTNYLTGSKLSMFALNVGLSLKF